MIASRPRLRPHPARVAWSSGALAVLACLATMALAPRADILTTIRIRATPLAVWSVLADTDAYPSWNPMIAGLKGRLAPGAVIENIEGYGDDRTIIWPTILVATPGHELRWRGRLWNIPGLFVGEHYFLLQPTSDGTRFTQGEHFTGALLWLFDPRQLVPPFEAMNAALAARAERASRQDLSPGTPAADGPSPPAALPAGCDRNPAPAR